jgi:Zn-dependent protease
MDSLSEGLQTLSIQFVPFVMAVVFHEFAHGFVAKRWGDPTAEDAGRLTLNPVPHMDPLGTLVFPILMMVSGAPVLFGWARPVPINPNRFRRYRPGLFWVSLAGPGMNFTLACVSAAAFCAIQTWMPETFYLYQPLMAMTVASVTLNYALGIFNLIPLPPLDGSKMVESILPLKTTQRLAPLARYSGLLLLGLLFTGALNVLRYPILYFSSITLNLMALAFGLPQLT